MQPPKAFPRFFPTLTEVVQPGAPAQMSTPVLPAVDRERLVEQVLQQIAPVVEERLHEAVQAMLQDQMNALARRLHQEIEITVRQAVIQATTENQRKT